jgi:hypothetical protein
LSRAEKLEILTLAVMVAVWLEVWVLVVMAEVL